MDGTVLLADDDRTIRTVLTQALTRAGCKVHATASMSTLMRWVSEGKGDLVVSDVVMPDGNGLEQLPKIGQMRPGLPVIIISAQNSITTAIKANEGAAYDYLAKPFDLPDLLKRVSQGLAVKKTVPSENQPQAPRMSDLSLVGRSAAMQSLYQLIARVMNAPVSLLVHGESGTGKTLISRTIHELSERAKGPLIQVDDLMLETPAAIAKLFDDARSGTIVFEDVSEMPNSSQRYLAQAMDSLSGDQDEPRFIATTNRNLGQLVDQGEFRQDLYYRLNGVEVQVPALRQRVDDIVIIADHFVQKFGGSLQLSDGAAKELKKQPWHGNVRELENFIQRLSLTSQDANVSEASIAHAFSENRPLMPDASAPMGAKLSDSVGAHLQHYFDLHGEELPPSGLYPRILREIEAPLLEIAMDATGGNQAKCADLLGINRNTLRKKLTELDIHVTRRRKLM